MFVLPIFGFCCIIVIPLVWFFLVPKIARKLTWDRFRKISYHFVADDTGYSYLLSTDVELPEGVVHTKKGWRFLPRPAKQGNPGSLEDTDIEGLMRKKYVWKDMGKPIWFDYAGKVTSANPSTLAALEKPAKEIVGLQVKIAEMKEYLGDLALTKNIRKKLTKILDDLKILSTAKPLTTIDPSKIKSLYSKMFTPSLILALAQNREDYGRKQAGKDYGKLILGGSLIIGLVIIALVVVLMLSGGLGGRFQPSSYVPP